MSRWLWVSLFGAAIVSACVLPDVEVDPELGGDPVGAAGVAGAGVSVPPSGGSGGAGGNTDVVVGPVNPGAGGSAIDDINTGDNQGGSSGAAGSGGAGGSGGAAGSGGSGGSGAGGTAAGMGGTVGDPIECDTETDREAACIQYCAFYLDACTDNEANTYGGLTDCTMTCFTSMWPVGTGDQKGSICCRYLHANLARTIGVDPHCFHSAEVPSKGETGAGCALAPAS